MKRELAPGVLMIGGVLMVVGSLLVQLNMRENAPVGSRIWF
jgi:hypothetical protein